MLTSADKRAAFRKLHEGGCFIIPNPFDVGSAKALQHLGFKALASTSAGFAWTLGKADNRVTVDDVCDHLTAICAAVEIPVNADFEDGFAHEPDGVAVNVARAVKTGVAGLSIEDYTGDNAKPLFDRALKMLVERGTLVHEGDKVRRATFKVKLSTEDAACAAEIEKAVRETRFNTPRIEEL